MTWKEVIKKEMSKKEKMVFYRYRASKILFILGSFLFFINFFFVGANFYPEIFQVSLPGTYVFFCFTLFFLIFYFCKQKFLSKSTKDILLSTILAIFLVVMCAVALLPVFFQWGIFYFINM